MSKNQRTMLLVLTIINLLNYLDRQVVFPLFGHIKAEFGLTDFHLGILGTVFLLVQSIAALPMGILADKFSRRVIVAGTLAFWSLATFLTGLSRNFGQMLGFRAMVGIGEAGYGPSAAAIISDNFPEHQNARVQGFFHVGMLVGGTLGAIIGGLIAYYFDNWRLAFFLVSIPGFVLAYYALRMHDKKLEHNEPVVPLRTLLHNRAYVWLTISGTFVAFASGAFITWGIEFINRYKHYNVRDASLILGFGMMIASVVGVLAGSYIADRLHRRYSWGRAAVVTVSLVVSAPLLYLGLSDVPANIFLPLFCVGAAFLSVYLGPVTAVLHDIVPVQFRASAFGIYVFFIHLVGESFAPAIVGAFSDHAGLRAALQFSTLCILLAGLCFVPVVWEMRKRVRE